jgi:hypothetical protein
MRRCYAVRKLVAPATARNRDPIRDVLARYVRPGPLPVLEIASGSGEHAVHLARAFPDTPWQPTDRDSDALASIAAWRAESALPNLRAPLPLDVTAAWPAEVGQAQLIVCINMIHIAPWEATLALMAGAARLLAAGAHLFLYGPYRCFGLPTAPSNESFDASLRSRDPRWGVRDLAEVGGAAAARGFVLHEVVAMPANNHCVVFRRG